MDNLEEVDKCLENYNIPKLNQEEIEIVNRPITSSRIKIVTKNLPTNRNQQHIKKIIHLDQVALSQGCKDSSIFANQSM